MIKFRCPHCQQKLGVPDEYAGRQIRCNKCSKPSTVPKPVSPQSVQSPEIADVPAPVNVPDDEAARQEAIRLAAKDRSRSSQKPSRQKHDKSSGDRASSRQQSGRLTLQEMIPDFLRLPLGVVFGFVASGLVVLIWTMCSRTTANALCFMALFVPVAAAYVLRLLIIERGVLAGLLCVVIGGLSIAGGKAAIAHFVVIPYFQDIANEEVLTKLESILADPDLKYPSSESIKPFTRDGDFMTCAGLVCLVEEGQADPIKARSWAVHIMLHSNKLSLLDLFDSATGGPGAAQIPPIPNLTAEDEAVMEKVWVRLTQWSDEEKELQMARTYYPAVSKMTQQAKILDTFKDKRLTYQLAFLNTLGLFDLVWIFLGLGMGYAVTVFD